MFPEHARKLHALISSLFTAPELRAWVWLCEAARPVHDTLPGESASKEELVQSLVWGLSRYGLVGDALFGSMLVARPARAEEIGAVAAIFGKTPRPPRATYAHLRPLSRAEQVEALEELLLDRSRHERDGRFPVDLAPRIDHLVTELMEDARPKPRDILAGAELLKPIGSGNFGTIWLAEDETGREVAVKTFHLEKLGEGIMLWRFRRSIKAMTHLAIDRRRPDTIAPLMSVAPDTLAFSMPFFPGGNLEDVARRGWALNVKLTLFLNICRAVAFAHKVGIIHRDIKPANVVLDATGRPVLTDFDISDIKFATRLSSAGGLGTPIFAAPEQLDEGDRADERSDVYSLGRLLHYLLLERSPGYQLEKDPTLDNLSRHSPALVAIVRRACQVDPTRRHQNVNRLIQELEQHQTGLARARAQARRAGRWVRQNWAVLSIAALVSGGSTVGALMQRQTAEREAVMRRTIEQLAARQSELVEELRAQQRIGLDLNKQRADLEQRRERLRLKQSAIVLSDDDKRRLRDEEQELDQQLAALESAARDAEAKMKTLEEEMTKLNEQLGQIRSKAEETTSTDGVDGPTPPPPVTPGALIAEPCPIPGNGGPTGRSYETVTPDLGMTFVGLTAGRFCMGSPTGSGPGVERPQHAVTLSPFMMGKTEVTQAQWQAVLTAARAAGDAEAKALRMGPGAQRGALQPMVQVSWCDAVRFANVLSRLEGRAPAYVITGDCTVQWDPAANGFRLPTEAEWEFVARAGAVTAKGEAVDEEALGRAAWYDGNSGGQAHQVCTKQAMPWGLCDMQGNVWEWVWDGYADYPHGEQHDPRVDDGHLRIQRGGSFDNVSLNTRASDRNWEEVTSSSRLVGFRLAVASPPPTVDPKAH